MSQKWTYNQMEENQNGLSIRGDVTLIQPLLIYKFFNDFSGLLRCYHQETESRLIINLPLLKIRNEKRAFE